LSEKWRKLNLSLLTNGSSISTQNDGPSVFKTYNVYDYAVDLRVDNDDNDGNDEGKL